MIFWIRKKERKKERRIVQSSWYYSKSVGLRPRSEEVSSNSSRVIMFTFVLISLPTSNGLDCKSDISPMVGVFANGPGDWTQSQVESY